MHKGAVGSLFYAAAGQGRRLLNNKTTERPLKGLFSAEGG